MAALKSTVLIPTNFKESSESFPYASTWCVAYLDKDHLKISKIPAVYMLSTHVLLSIEGLLCH